MDAHPRLVYLGDRMLRIPADLDMVQCVARTTDRQRCRRLVGLTRSGSWSTVRTPNGAVDVYRPVGDAGTVRRWLAQHCRLHDRPTTVDVQPPQWQRFDPRRTYAHAASADTPR